VPALPRTSEVRGDRTEASVLFLLAGLAGGALLEVLNLAGTLTVHWDRFATLVWRLVH
jgi:hypothetical protein